MAEGAGLRILILYNASEYVARFRLPLVERLVADGHEVAVLSPRDRFVPEIEAAGAEWQDWPVSGRGLSPLRDLACQRALRRQTAQRRPDVILSFTIKCLLHGGWVSQRHPGIRHLPTLTGRGDLFTSDSPLMRALRLLILPWYRRSLKSAERVFVQNQDDAHFITDDMGVPAARVTRVAGSGIDCDYLTPPAEAPEQDLTLVARLTRSKGVADYVAALRRVRQQQPRLRATLVGPLVAGRDGIPEPVVADWVRQGLVDYRGFISDATTAIADARIYVLPSLGEGMPRTVLEAMALGRPVIATDVRGCREAVEHGVTGLLVPPRDPEALAEAIISLLGDPETCQRMGAAGRERARQRFSQREVVETYCGQIYGQGQV